MKAQILSDLHLEMGNDFQISDCSADVVLLAGDISNHTAGIHWAGEQARRLRKPIVYVAGNHEFHRGDHQAVLLQLKDQARQEGIHFLEQDSITLAGVRILGCTLWFSGDGTSSARGRKQLSQRLNDFSMISNCGQAFDLTYAARLHQQAVDWLDQKLSEPYDGQTVVLTHHAPSLRSWPWRWTRWGGVTPNWARPAYCTDLGWLMERYRPALWVHGHVHAASQYQIGSTEVVCNPFGASEGEAVGFEKTKLIEL